MGLVANENIIVAPGGSACCYNICLPVDSAVIRAAQRPAPLSSHKGEQESRKLSRRYTTHARVRRASRGRGEIEEHGERGRGVTIIMHSCPGPGSPMSKYIYCPPPLARFFAPVAVCRPPLSPFHTVITHLYVAETSSTIPFNGLKPRRDVLLRSVHGILELEAISTIARGQR